jgi:DNA-binding NarL/FixJ family response regulator
VAYEFPIPELEPLREAAGDGALANAREKGRAMPVSQVVADFIKRGLDGGPTGSRNCGPLTTREAEVARLVANGWSNRAIAEQLVVAERTVENHVSHILDKLGLSSRTQLASRMLSLEAR